MTTTRNRLRAHVWVVVLLVIAFLVIVLTGCAQTPSSDEQLHWQTFHGVDCITDYHGSITCDWAAYDRGR